MAKKNEDIKKEVIDVKPSKKQKVSKKKDTQKVKIEKDSIKSKEKVDQIEKNNISPLEEKKAKAKAFYETHIKKNTFNVIVWTVIALLLIIIIQMSFVISWKSTTIKQISNDNDVLSHSITKVTQEYKDLSHELEKVYKENAINIEKLDRISDIINE